MISILLIILETCHSILCLNLSHVILCQCFGGGYAELLIPYKHPSTNRSSASFMLATWIKVISPVIVLLLNSNTTLVLLISSSSFYAFILSNLFIWNYQIIFFLGYQQTSANVMYTPQSIPFLRQAWLCHFLPSRRSPNKIHKDTTYRHLPQPANQEIARYAFLLSKGPWFKPIVICGAGPYRHPHSNSATT